jgi:hypothetical protein
MTCFKDFSRTNTADNFPKILTIADCMRDIGVRLAATAGQVALAYLLMQGDDIIPIPGTRKLKVGFLLATLALCTHALSIVSDGEFEVFGRQAECRPIGSGPCARGEERCTRLI